MPDLRFVVRNRAQGNALTQRTRTVCFAPVAEPPAREVLAFRAGFVVRIPLREIVPPRGLHVRQIAIGVQVLIFCTGHSQAFDQGSRRLVVGTEILSAELLYESSHDDQPMAKLRALT